MGNAGSKVFPAGPVTLGGNREAGQQAGPNMYTVIITEPWQTSAENWVLY